MLSKQLSLNTTYLPKLLELKTGLFPNHEYDHYMNFKRVLREKKPRIEGTRQWAFEEIEKWRKEEIGICKKSTLLVAPNGFGKSTIVSAYAQKYPKNILADFYVSQDFPDSLNPFFMVKCIAFQILEKCKNYQEILMEASIYYDFFEDLSKCNLVSIFKRLLTEPLYKSNLDKNPLIIIDGIDNFDHSIKKDFFRIINDATNTMFTWKLLMTSRPDCDTCLTKKYATIKFFPLNDKQYEDKIKDDSNIVCKQLLSNRVMSEDELTGMTQRTFDLYRGNFMFLKLLKSALDITCIPQVIFEWYQKELTAILEKCNQVQSKNIIKLIQRISFQEDEINLNDKQELKECKLNNKEIEELIFYTPFTHLFPITKGWIAHPLPAIPKQISNYLEFVPKVDAENKSSSFKALLQRQIIFDSTILRSIKSEMGYHRKLNLKVLVNNSSGLIKVSQFLGLPTNNNKKQELANLAKCSFTRDFSLGQSKAYEESLISCSPAQKKMYN